MLGSHGAPFLTPADVSRRLGVPPGTLANWRYLSRGPAFLKVGRHVRYRAADVEAWLEGQLQHAGQPLGHGLGAAPRSRGPASGRN